MARKHRVLSLSTKLKIAASLHGNKNAYRGGPKKRLTSRQKVENINARTRQKRLVLNDAQLKQRSAVAKRLRARARSEESGISPAHTKSIATPSTVTKQDSKIRADSARAKGSIAKAETKSAGTTDVKKLQAGRTEADRAALAKNYEAMHGTQGVRDLVSRLEKRKTLSSAEKSNLSAAKKLLSDRTAKTNTGKGNFSKNETGSGSVRELNRSHITPEKIVSDNQKNRILGNIKSANRSDPAKIGDPTVKMNTPHPVDRKEALQQRIASETNPTKQNELINQFMKEFPDKQAAKVGPSRNGYKAANTRAARTYKAKPMPRGGFGGKGL